MTRTTRRPRARRSTNGSSYLVGRRRVVAILLAAQATVGETPSPDPGVDVASLSLEELTQVKVQTVYSAAKHEQKVTDAPAAATVVTRDTIQKQGYRTLADILNGVSGFYTIYNRCYQFVGVRGFHSLNDYGGRFLVTVDGHRLNDPLYDGQFVGTELPLDVDLIERVEVIRGPGSVMYGNNALFGVVNVVTRRGRDLQGAEASASYGSFDTWTGRATYGQRMTNGVEFAVSGTLLESEGHERLYYPEYRETNGGYAQNLDGSAVRTFFASVSYLGLTLEGGYLDRTKAVPTAAFGALFNDPHYQSADHKSFADLKFDHTLENELELSARAYFDSTIFVGDTPYPYNYEDPPPPGMSTMDYERDRARSYGLELQASRSVLERHRLTLGGEIRFDSPLEIRVWDDDPAAVWMDVLENQTVLGLYLQDEYSILPNLVLHAGARYDNYSTFGDALNPRAGLVYTPWSTTTFKALYGQAYRAPNMTEWGWVGPGFRANPDLGPETVGTFELVAEHRFGERLAANASVFRSDVDALIVSTYDPVGDVYYSANVGGAVSQGLEAGLVAQWPGGWRGSVSYTYADATDEETGAWLSNSPRHLGKLQLTAPVYVEKVFVSLELLTMSERATGRGGLVPAYGIANLTLFSRDLAQGLELSASIYNLFDSVYRDPASDGFRQESIVQDGRAFRVKLGYRF